LNSAQYVTVQIGGGFSVSKLQIFINRNVDRDIPISIYSNLGKEISMNIYTGYIYLWYDTKAKLFYLGGHKGKVEDSYICSNKMMIRAYKKRPNTFKFKILQYTYGDNKDLREAEQHWLNFIKNEELYWTQNIYNKTVKYYNQKKHSAGGNGSANKGKSHSPWNKGLTKEKDSRLAKSGRKAFILEKRSCPICSNEFSVKPYSKKTFCSYSCSNKSRYMC